ncbi:MAG: hypothetical protein RL545_896, partial [Actinomycetota bacterium]
MGLQEKVTRRLTYRRGSGKLIDQVLFVSFGGKQVSDSPLDIFFELQKTRPKLKLVWAVVSSDQTVPAGASKVLVGSVEWFSALSKSKYLVSNNNLPQIDTRYQPLETLACASTFCTAGRAPMPGSVSRMSPTAVAAGPSSFLP